jgi:hypothetical protein
MKPKNLRLRQALDLMHLPDRRLVEMHTPHGLAHFVVHGGPVSKEVALTIISRPDVHAFDDGLFPGCPQSWRLGSRR